MPVIVFLLGTAASLPRPPPSLVVSLALSLTLDPTYPCVIPCECMVSVSASSAMRCWFASDAAA